MLKASDLAAVSAFVYGSILALLSNTLESCSSDGSGSRRDRFKQRSALAGARCEQRAALAKSFEITHAPLPFLASNPVLQPLDRAQSTRE